MNKKSTLGSVANNYLTHPRLNKGITLIALVITIIVLLILAGIAISLALGDNGLLVRAQSAHRIQTESQIQEQINLAYHSALVEGRGNVEKGTLEAELSKEFPGSEIIVTTDANDASKWVVTIDGVEVDLPAGIATGNNNNGIPQSVTLVLSGGFFPIQVDTSSCSSVDDVAIAVHEAHQEAHGRVGSRCYYADEEMSTVVFCAPFLDGQNDPNTIIPDTLYAEW